MTHAIDFIRPSNLSAAGGILDSFAQIETKHAAAPLWYKTAYRIYFVAVLWFCAGTDLVSWVWATVTVRHARQVGFSNHVANLTATLAIVILGLGIPFGQYPKSHFLRPSYHAVFASNERPLAYPFIEALDKRWNCT